MSDHPECRCGNPQTVHTTKQHEFPVVALGWRCFIGRHVECKGVGRSLHELGKQGVDYRCDCECHRRAS